MTKNNLESKGFVLLTLHAHITVYHFRKSRQEPGVRTEAEAMEELWLALNGFFSPFPMQLRATWPEVTLPVTQENTLQTCTHKI